MTKEEFLDKVIYQYTYCIETNEIKVSIIDNAYKKFFLGNNYIEISNQNINGHSREVLYTPDEIYMLDRDLLLNSSQTVFYKHSELRLFEEQFKQELLDFFKEQSITFAINLANLEQRIDECKNLFKQCTDTFNRLEHELNHPICSDEELDETIDTND